MNYGFTVGVLAGMAIGACLAIGAVMLGVAMARLDTREPEPERLVRRARDLDGRATRPKWLGV